MQSRQLLLETKKAQLHQIEEKKMIRQKEKEIEKQWLTVMKKLHKEREYQDIYEEKLRKVIEGTNQSKNQEIDHSNKMRQHIEMEQCRKEEYEEYDYILNRLIAVIWYLTISLFFHNTCL